MAETNLTPETAVIYSFLQHITSRWDELTEPALLECVFLSSENKARVVDVRHYDPTPESLLQAAEHYAAMNAHSVNGYTTINPVSAARRPAAGKRADTGAILASFFHWADADTALAAENIKNFAGPKCNFHVLTGSQPTLRPHVYWELEDPAQNLAAWTETQRGIAKTLKTDGQVVDPPRIMRTPGTINWPKPDKEAKGYKPEVVLLRFYEDRPLVTSAQMARVFSAAREEPRDSTFDFDTGGDDSKSAEDYAEILRRARTDGEKHGGVRDLAASLAGAQVPIQLARAIVREACPVWDEGVENLILTAYEKFYKKPEEPNFDHPASEDGPRWKVQTAADFTADFVAPEYLVEGVIQRGRLYTLTAPTGAGKTAAMLYASAVISSGNQFCGLEVEPGDVLFLAGENPDDVRARFIATMEFYGISPKNCRVHFVAGTFSIRKDMERLKQAAESLPNLVMIVVDTFAAYFDGDDENSNAQALDFARVVRGLTALKSKPAAIMPAHPIKNATRGNLTPKGGSSLLNEVDGNLTLWNTDGLVSMHWQGKHRGPEFEPLTMELERYECEAIKDRKGRIMPTVLAKPVLTLRAQQLARESIALEDQLLLNIADDETLSQRQRREALGIGGGTYSRLIDRLRADKLIEKFRRKWRLTKLGKEAVDEITAGIAQPEDEPNVE